MASTDGRTRIMPASVSTPVHASDNKLFHRGLWVIGGVLAFSLVMFFIAGRHHESSSTQSASAGRTVSSGRCVHIPPQRAEPLTHRWENPCSGDLIYTITKGTVRLYFPGGSRVVSAGQTLEAVTPVTYTAVEPIGYVEWFHTLCDKGTAIPSSWSCGYYRSS